MSRLDERIGGVSARLGEVGTDRELEKYKLHVQVYIEDTGRLNFQNHFSRMWRKSPLCCTV